MAELNKPRFLIGATHSGAGKTTVTVAILAALKKRGIKAASFKCGPDYIDPMFHEGALKTKSRNLDLWLIPENALLSLAQENSKDSDIAVIEGVMGYYDGKSFGDTAYSSADIARALKAPSVIVIDASGMSTSVLAILSGFKGYAENTIEGFILNNCSKQYADLIAKAAFEAFGLKCFGFLPKIPGAGLKSRHLGLVTAQEVEGLEGIIENLANAAEESIDIGSLIELAKTAPAFEIEALSPPKMEPAEVTCAVARDKAFCFYYQDNIDLLEKLGAKIEYFSPLEGECVPKGADLLYLGGGYPELYLEGLSSNASMLESVKSAIESGMPAYAECGGYMYLHDAVAGENGELFSLVGIVGGMCYKTPKLVRFGYCETVATEDCSILKAGEKLRCHEFHYYESSHETSLNSGMAPFYTLKGGKQTPSGFKHKNLAAGFPHAHFYSNPMSAARLISAASEYKKSKIEQRTPKA